VWVGECGCVCVCVCGYVSMVVCVAVCCVVLCCVVLCCVVLCCVVLCCVVLCCVVCVLYCLTTSSAPTRSSTNLGVVGCGWLLLGLIMAWLPLLGLGV
jgi:hypothetical protein